MANANFWVTFMWMRDKLGLTGNELQIYAIIYGFSQNLTKRSRYYGTREYLANAIGLTTRGVQKILNKLVDGGFIIKHGDTKSGVGIEYSVEPNLCKWARGDDEKVEELCSNSENPKKSWGTLFPQLGNFVPQVRELCSPNNNIDNNNDNKERNIIKKEKAEEHSTANQPNLVVEHSTDMPNGGEAKSTAKEDAEEIYKLYPTTCLNTGRRTGKSTKDKEKIIRLLKTHTKEELKFTIQKYIYLSIRDKTYMMNFSTFLNHLPDYSDLTEKEKETKLELDQQVGYKDF